LTFHQPSSARKTRATEALVHYTPDNCVARIGFVDGISLLLLKVQLATYTGFHQEVDQKSQPQHKHFTVVLFLNLLDMYRKFSIKKIISL